MKKIFKYLIIILIAFFAYQFIDSKINPKPFRFEDFETQKEANNKLREMYPYGSDYGKLLTDLIKAGAHCKLLPMEQFRKYSEFSTYSEMQDCKYLSGIISTKPFVRYDIRIGKSDKNEITVISVSIEYVGL